MSAEQRTDAPTPARHASGPTLTVGIIGAGRVGAALGAALDRAGHHVVAVSTTAPDRVRALLPKTEVRPVDRVTDGTDLLILAVPDDALPGLVNGLAVAGLIRPGQLVAHTSGAHGLAVLGPAAALGARPLALHPAMTFTGTSADLDRLADRPVFGVTAPQHLRPLAAQLVADLGGVVEWVPEERRALYHASLAHGANHLVTLVNEAVDQLRAAGVADPAAVLRPLLGAALDNALRLGDCALTGPVVRGDAGTVEAHLRVLTDAAPQTLTPYLAMARRTADRAIASGRLRSTDAGPLLQVLADRADAEREGSGREGSGRHGSGRDGSGRVDVARAANGRVDEEAVA